MGVKGKGSLSLPLFHKITRLQTVSFSSLFSRLFSTNIKEKEHSVILFIYSFFALFSLFSFLFVFFSYYGY